MSALQRFEGIADAAFARYPIPHPNGHVANWYMLTVAEDSQRLALNVRVEDGAEWGVEHLLDRCKFALRSCLSRVRGEARDWTPTILPTRAIEQLYVRGQSLLLAGVDYALVLQVCSAAHSGNARVLEEEGVFRVELVEGLLDRSYGALEAMRQSAGEFFTPHYTLFWLWNVEHDRRPRVLRQIAASTRLKGRRILYEYDQELAIDLAGELQQPPSLVPAAWQFLWGGASETVVLINAVSVRAFYHLAAVQFGAERFALKGGAEHDLCLVQSREKWVEDIELMSSVDRTRIVSFVDQLTFGTGTNSPDQALQPFVPLGSGNLGFGPLGWLSSNHERNLLSLQARLLPQALDRQSHLFEAAMTEKLHSAVRLRWPLVAANRTFSVGGRKEEFDLLVCEPATRTVLILELRWILPPADPREVENKSTVCRQKVSQVVRKRDLLMSDLRRVLMTAFDVEIDPADAWSIHAFAVIEGFGGVLSPDATVPLIPEWVLLAGVPAAPTLQRLVEWTTDLEWIPKAGREFEVVEEAKPWLNDFELRYPALIPLRAGRSYLADAIAALRE